MPLESNGTKSTKLTTNGPENFARKVGKPTPNYGSPQDLVRFGRVVEPRGLRETPAAGRECVALSSRKRRQNHKSIVGPRPLHK